MKHGHTIGDRSGGSFNFGRVFLIVIGIHVAAGGGVLWLANTKSGQQFAKQYDIKLFEPPKPEQAEEPPKPEETPPPPPIEQPKLETPAVAAAAVPAAPQIGGGQRGGSSWSGGKFVGGFEDGPAGAYKAGLTRQLRSLLPDTLSAQVDVEMVVTGAGRVKSYRLTRSSGDSGTDQLVLDAARKVQAQGTAETPERKATAVTVRLIPSG